MARQRFSDLDQILEALRLANVDPNTLPQNLDFTIYAKFKQGDGEERNITRPSLGAAVPAGVIAFGLNATDAAAKVQVNWNTRAKTFYDGLANNNLFGIELAALGDYNENPSFKPAQVSIQLRSAGESERSKITGRKYKKNDNPSYTIPIGQTATVKYFQEAVQGLLSSTMNSLYHVSAKPEVWSRL